MSPSVCGFVDPPGCASLRGLENSVWPALKVVGVLDMHRFTYGPAWNAFQMHGVSRPNRAVMPVFESSNDP